MDHALLTVPSTWTANSAVGFSAEAYARWHEKIPPGCRVLVLMSTPVNAIVAEGEVQDNVFVRIDEWPVKPREPIYTGPGQEAAYVLPLRLLASFPPSDYVPEARIYELSDLKNVTSQEWIPLDVTLYQALRDYPN